MTIEQLKRANQLNIKIDNLTSLKSDLLDSSLYEVRFTDKTGDRWDLLFNSSNPTPLYHILMKAILDDFDNRLTTLKAEFDVI